MKFYFQFLQCLIISESNNKYQICLSFVDIYEYHGSNVLGYDSSSNLLVASHNIYGLKSHSFCTLHLYIAEI